MARTALSGTRIRERRTAIRMKQSDLARAAGISPAYLNLIEHNRRRAGEALLSDLAVALGVDPEALSEGAEGALFDGLREAAAALEATPAPDPGGAAGRPRAPEGPELDRIEEFVGRFPGWAALLAARQARVGLLEQVIERYSERMVQDPFLLDSLHGVLSAVTSLRSTAAILVETEDIEPEWRARFLRTIQEESLRLSETAEGLVGYLDELEQAETGLSTPLEQMEAWVAAAGWHFDAVEEPGFDAAGPTAEALIAGAPELASGAARRLAQAHLSRAHEAARALPLGPVAAALAEGAGVPFDPAALAARFGVPLATLFRRLATLPGDLPGLPPLGLVICDGSGAPTFRRPAPGFTLPRFGAGCPLWPLYEALARPMQPIRAVIDLAGRLPQRFQSYAVAIPRGTAGFDGPVLLEALMLVLPAPAPMPAGTPERAVGVTCRICPRATCPGRREPSLLGEEIAGV